MHKTTAEAGKMATTPTMRYARILVALCALFMLAKPAEAGRWVARACSECTGPQMWVIVLNESAGDTKTVAKELIAGHGGYLRAVWPSSKHRFAVEATQEEARAMLADARVALVDGRSERYFSAARSRATAEAGAFPETGSEFWSTGPYTYDGAGNITRIGPNVWPGSTGWDKADEFQYDRVNRLINANVTAQMPGTAAPGAVQWSESYQYDAYGNLGMKTTTRGEGVTPETLTIAVDPATNRLSGSLNPNGTRYDHAGNYLGVDGISSTFDAVNQMTSRTVSSGTERYLYTADDERVAIKMANGSTLYTIRGLDQKILREFEQPAVGQPLVWKKDYIWRGGSLLATVGANGKTTHFHLDHLGTPRLLTDESGNKAAMNAYLPFGEEISDGETDTERLKFTGHERDDRASSATALDYMHARSYNPNLGRFLSVDPVLGEPTAPQTWNRYGYVRNNAMLFSDPTGLEERPLTDENCTSSSPGLVICEGFEIDAYPDTAGQETLNTEYLFSARNLGGAAIGTLDKVGYDIAAPFGTAITGLIAGDYGSAVNGGLKIIATAVLGGIGTASTALTPSPSNRLSIFGGVVGRTQGWSPMNLQEQMAGTEGASGGKPILDGQIGDPYFRSQYFDKVEYTHTTLTGHKVTVHFFRDRITGEVVGLKIKPPKGFGN